MVKKRAGTLRFWEIVFVLLLVGLGAFMVWEGSSYPFGNLRRMGPGFFPVWLGILLLGFGGALVFEVRNLPGTAPSIPPRPLVMIMAGLVAFALSVERFGLIPATVALVALSSLGRRGTGPKAIVGTTVVAVAIGYFVFVRGFGVPLQGFRWDP